MKKKQPKTVFRQPQPSSTQRIACSTNKKKLEEKPLHQKNIYVVFCPGENNNEQILTLQKLPPFRKLQNPRRFAAATASAAFKEHSRHSSSH